MSKLLALFAAILLSSAVVSAADYPFPVEQYPSPHDFDTLWERLDQAVSDSPLFVVYRASASRAAAGRGIDIPGNGVFGVYNNQFAVRMLAASVPAGIHAPLVLYLTSHDDGSTTLSYRPATDQFAPYGSADLDAMATELDSMLATIVNQATAAE